MFINLTPHIIRIKGNTKEKEAVLELPPSGNVATCRPIMGDTKEILQDGVIVLVRTRTLGEVTLSSGQPFPAQTAGKMYLVSSMVQEALPRPDVLAPDTGPTAIRDSKGMVWAVTGLIGPK